MSAADAPTLSAARRYCRDVTRRRARNFFYGLRLLPPAKRDALYTLYAWMRRADDLVDGAIDRPDDALQQLEQFRAQTLGVLRGGPIVVEHDGCADPHLWLALAELRRKHALDTALFDAMIDGQAMDLRPEGNATWTQLEQYCHQVASSVGLLCIEIWGYEHDRARELAVARGVAFQLTNILRDFQEDYEAGRVYLPAELFRGNGLTAEELSKWAKPEACRALVLEAADRAQQCYDTSRELEQLISADSRPTLIAMTDIYRGLLERMRRSPSCVANGPRIRLNAARKLLIAGRAVWRRRFAGSGVLDPAS